MLYHEYANVFAVLCLVVVILSALCSHVMHLPIFLRVFWHWDSHVIDPGASEAILKNMSKNNRKPQRTCNTTKTNQSEIKLCVFLMEFTVTVRSGVCAATCRSFVASLWKRQGPQVGITWAKPPLVAPFVVFTEWSALSLHCTLETILVCQRSWHEIRDLVHYMALL